MSDYEAGAYAEGADLEAMQEREWARWEEADKRTCPDCGRTFSGIQWDHRLKEDRRWPPVARNIPPGAKCPWNCGTAAHVDRFRAGTIGHDEYDYDPHAKHFGSSDIHEWTRRDLRESRRRRGVYDASQDHEGAA